VSSFNRNAALPAEQQVIKQGAGVSTTPDGRTLVQGTPEYEIYMAAIRAANKHPGMYVGSPVFAKIESAAKEAYYKKRKK